MTMEPQTVNKMLSKVYGVVYPSTSAYPIANIKNKASFGYDGRDIIITSF